MSNENTGLLSGSNKTTIDNGGATSTSDASASGRLLRLSRFGQFESTGVRASLESIPESMSNVPRQRRTSVTPSGLKQRGSARSFMQTVDGSVAALTPLEMGRHELYEEIPFLAVPGLQRKEHNLSIAFSSYAALMDNQETDEYLISTTGQGLKPEEKEKRLSRMSLMLLDELEVEAVSVTLPLVFAVAIASLLAFNVGYNISVMNPSEPSAFPGHTTSMWSIAVAAFCVGGPFGAVLAGKWADEKGRRGALLLTTWLFVIGGLIQTLAPTLSVVVFARMVIGVASGATTVLVPIYLGELAPPNLRGVIGTMTQFAMVIGILFADVVGFPLANESRWRYMFLLISVMGVCPWLMQSFLLESPRWLLGRDPDSAEARFVIKKLRGFRYDEEVETEVEHYVGASKSQSCASDDGTKKPKNATAELLADKKVRLLLVSSLVLQVSSQLSGINAVFYYSGLFFDGVIDNPLVGTTIVGAINVLACYIALLLMDRCGRRTLIMWSSAGMFCSCVVIVLALLGYFSKMVAIGAVASYVSFFEIGLGPIPWLIVAEMFEGKYVTVAMSISCQLNWSCNFFVGLLFPYVNESLGPYSFGPFAVVLLLTFLYAWIWLPETQGTTPAELQAALVKKNSGVTYHNMDIEGMAATAPPSQGEWEDALAALADEEQTGNYY
mmetsp:Transcript_16787/g.30486  ORF Transcript_16787/g.30486 Transcript_16787/m.30486 type:complete len:668 (-) Transcript_16787:260-2263(-)